MLSKNNSNPAVCVNNLIQIARGEVPYDRVKGVSFAHIDVPFAQQTDAIAADAEWMLGAYEPRVEVEGINVEPNDEQNGHFGINVNINTKKEEAHG